MPLPANRPLQFTRIAVSAGLALGVLAGAASAEIPESEIDLGNLLIRGTPSAAADAVVRLAIAGYDANIEEQLDTLGISRLEIAPSKGSGIDVPSAEDILAAVYGISPPQGLQEVGFAYVFGTGGGQTGSLWVTRTIPHTTNDFRSQYGVSETGLALDGLPTTGRGVTVAVLDSGVFAVGDLARVAIPVSIDTFSGALPTPGVPTLDPGGDGVDSDFDGVADEFVGHGSFVGSLIALVAPEARQLHVRCVDSDGRTSTIEIARGIQAAINAGADIINLSIVVPENIPHLQSILDAARLRGITVVASAGNFSQNILTYPGSYPSVASVASSGVSLTFSTSYATYNPTVDFCAPGETVVTGPTSSPQPVDGASVIGVIGIAATDPPTPIYAAATGSSFSCAWASGAAALVRSGHPDWPNASVPLGSMADAVINRLRETTNPVDTPPPLVKLVGTGILDCASACAFVTPGSVPLALPDIDPSGGVYRIDGADLASMLSAWGPVPTGRISYADLDHSGTIDGADLAILLSSWTSVP